MYVSDSAKRSCTNWSSSIVKGGSGFFSMKAFIKLKEAQDASTISKHFAGAFFVIRTRFVGLPTSVAKLSPKHLRCFHAAKLLDLAKLALDTKIHLCDGYTDSTMTDKSIAA